MAASKEALDYGYNILYENNNRLKSITTSVMGEITSIGEYRSNVKLAQGDIFYNVNSRLEADTLRAILSNLRFVDHLIDVDVESLNNPVVIEFLQDKVKNKEILGISIIDKNYTLTQDMYDKLSFIERIQVSHIAENLAVTPNCTAWPNYDVFFRDTQFKYGKENKLVNSYTVDRELNDEELNFLVQSINQNIYEEDENNLNIRFHKPELYANFLERLKASGLDERVNISLIGYPLTDSSELFKQIKSKTNNNINITYSCCHDMINLYCNPPYCSFNSYYSDLEPGSVANIDNYISILEFVEEFEKRVSGYDDLDKLMSAYNYLHDTKVYDQNLHSKGYDETRVLEEIINRDEIVCVGFSNLLTVMLRRVGVPCLTYGNEGHQRNIARIKVKGEDGQIIEDKICTIDPTFDAHKIGDNGEDLKHNFTYCGLSPDYFLQYNDTYIDTATSFVLPLDVLLENAYSSKDIFAGNYSSSYYGFGYAITLLELMGYDIEWKGNLKDFTDYCGTLCEKGRIGEINPKLMRESLKRVIQKEKGISDEEFEREYGRQFDASINQRINTNTYALWQNIEDKVTNNDLFNTTVPVTPMTKELPTYGFDRVEIKEIDDITRIDNRTTRPENTTTGPENTTTNNSNNNDVHSNPEGLSLEEYQSLYNKSIEIYNSVIADLRKLTEGIITSFSGRNTVLSELDIIVVNIINKYNSTINNHLSKLDEVSSRMKNISQECKNFHNIDLENRLKADELFNIYSTENIEYYLENVRNLYNQLIEYTRNNQTTEAIDNFIAVLRGILDKKLGLEQINPSKKKVSGNNNTNEEEVSETFGDDNLEEGYIAGTRVKRPRDRKENETEEEYVEFLKNYYEQYFPKAVEQTVEVYGENRYGLTRNQIIQDRPYNSREVQNFQAQGMSDEEIRRSQELIGGIRR